uniref:Uncharacterized protein n=1 Tax=Setaria italica TaxID=4555 RepID=K3Z2N9_SETIT
MESPGKTIFLIISWSESPSGNWTLVSSKSLPSADSILSFIISISNVWAWICSLRPKTCPAL